MGSDSSSSGKLPLGQDGDNTANQLDEYEYSFDDDEDSFEPEGLGGLFFEELAEAVVPFEGNVSRRHLEYALQHYARVFKKASELLERLPDTDSDLDQIEMLFLDALQALRRHIAGVRTASKDTDKRNLIIEFIVNEVASYLDETNRPGNDPHATAFWIWCSCAGIPDKERPEAGFAHTIDEALAEHLQAEAVQDAILLGLQGQRAVMIYRLDSLLRGKEIDTATGPDAKNRRDKVARLFNKWLENRASTAVK